MKEVHIVRAETLSRTACHLSGDGMGPCGLSPIGRHLACILLFRISKHGRVPLKGVGATKADSQRAYSKARGVPSLCEVNNGPRVEPPHGADKEEKP